MALILMFSLCGFAGECGQIRERCCACTYWPIPTARISSSSCRCGTRWSPPPRDCSTAFRTKGSSGTRPGTAASSGGNRPAGHRRRQGYDYDVEISLRNMYFTTRFYDGVNGGESVTLPAACTTPSALISARGGTQLVVRGISAAVRFAAQEPAEAQSSATWTMCWIRAAGNRHQAGQIRGAL